MLDDNNIDLSIPFLLPRFSLRGRLVRLQKVNDTILTQHAYPDPIAKVLVELLAAAGVLSQLLKYEGVFTLQTKTSGPLSLVVIDATHEGHMRGYGQFRPQEIRPGAMFQELLGRGYLAFTVDQGLKVDRYQGIVDLSQDSLSQALEHYFQQSEQLDTKIFIASEKTAEGSWKSTALLLQQMPSQKVKEEVWDYIDSLLLTLSSKEFLDFSIDYEKLLYRLFHEGDLTVFDSLPLQAKCRCSKERIQAFFTTLSSDEIESLLEQGHLKMTCEFCNHLYEFDRKDLMTVH